MINTQTAQMLAAYKAWSNTILYDAMANLPQYGLDAKVDLILKKILRTLNHIYIIDNIWLAHLEGRQHGYTARNTADYPPLIELRDLQQKVDQHYITLINQTSDNELAAALDFHFVSGKSGRMTRSDMLLHIVTHTCYHRGNIATLFSQLELSPPKMDLCIYLTS